MTSWVKLFLSCYFSNITVEGKENLPEAKNVMVVSNHTNSLVDPFIIWAALEHPVRMTAKKALLKNPLLWIILKGLNAITFIRGDSSTKREAVEYNLKAFGKCRKSIHNAEWLCIFPEGKSHTLASMMLFKTGAARIALGFLEHYPEEELWVLPVGLFYEKKYRFGSRVLCKVGEPFELRAWVEGQIRANSRELTRCFEAKVRAVTLNFQTRAQSVLLQFAADMWQLNGKEPYPLGVSNKLHGDKVNVAQTLAKKYYQFKDLPQVKEIEADVFRLRKRMKQYGLSIKELYLPMNAAKAVFFLFRECELVLLGLPLFLVGVIGNFIPFALLFFGVRLISKDLDQWASNYLFGGVGVFGVYYLLIAAAGLLISPFWTAVLLVVIAYSGYFALLYVNRVSESAIRARTFLMFTVNPDLRKELHDECRRIINRMSEFNNLQ